MSWSGKNQALRIAPTQHDVEDMLARAHASYLVKRVPKDALLFWEGEPHENHYYLAEGLVEVFTVDGAGRKKSVDFYRPGSFFGFQILLDDNLPMTTARACKAKGWSRSVATACAWSTWTSCARSRTWNGNEAKKYHAAETWALCGVAGPSPQGREGRRLGPLRRPVPRAEAWGTGAYIQRLIAV